MTRSITVHPASLALGLVLAVVCVLGMSQSTVTNPLRVQYLAHPRDMIQVKEGTPLVVPASKIFVLTGLGFSSAQSAGTPTLAVNGQIEVTVEIAHPSSQSEVLAVPTGFSAAAGSTVTVAPQNARAWGYLADQ